MQFIQEKNFFDKFKSLDFLMITIVLLIGFISIFAMYSTEGGKLGYHTSSHVIRFGVFFVFFLGLSFLNVRFWYSVSYLFYFVVLLMLIWAIYFGITASGSQRWINLYFINIQPSELMKIAIIICFAKYYHRLQSTEVNKVKNLIYPLFLIMVPIFLVIAQPDLGTAILIAISGIVVVFLSGVNIKYFIYSFVIFLISTPFAISFLKPYQKLRILTFLNPERDPLGAGYQIIQSKIAIGSGGLFGKGFLKGTQSYLDFLPEKHTDFIFTLFSEEFGFIGSIFLLILYLILIYRIIRIGFSSKSFFAKFYCISFGFSLSMFIIINMSMVIGLLPIVGSPLPIMSYGGSSMMATMVGLAVVMSCKIYEKEIIV